MNWKYLLSLSQMLLSGCFLRGKDPQCSCQQVWKWKHGYLADASKRRTWIPCLQLCDMSVIAQELQSKETRCPQIRGWTWKDIKLTFNICDTGVFVLSWISFQDLVRDHVIPFLKQLIIKSTPPTIFPMGLSHSGLLHNHPNQPRARYQKTRDSLWPEPTEIIQISQT